MLRDTSTEMSLTKALPPWSLWDFGGCGGRRGSRDTDEETDSKSQGLRETTEGAFHLLSGQGKVSPNNPAKGNVRGLGDRRSKGWGEGVANSHGSLWWPGRAAFYTLESQCLLLELHRPH